MLRFGDKGGSCGNTRVYRRACPILSSSACEPLTCEAVSVLAILSGCESRSVQVPALSRATSPRAVARIQLPAMSSATSDALHLPRMSVTRQMEKSSSCCARCAQVGNTRRNRRGRGASSRTPMHGHAHGPRRGEDARSSEYTQQQCVAWSIQHLFSSMPLGTSQQGTCQPSST